MQFEADYLFLGDKKEGEAKRKLVYSPAALFLVSYWLDNEIIVFSRLIPDLFKLPLEWCKKLVEYKPAAIHPYQSKKSS